MNYILYKKKFFLRHPFQNIVTTDTVLIETAFMHLFTLCFKSSVCRCKLESWFHIFKNINHASGWLRIQALRPFHLNCPAPPHSAFQLASKQKIMSNSNKTNSLGLNFPPSEDWNLIVIENKVFVAGSLFFTWGHLESTE